MSCIKSIIVDHQQQQGVNTKKLLFLKSLPENHVKQLQWQAQMHLLDVQPIDGQSLSLLTAQMGRLTLTSCSYSLLPCHMPQLIIIY